MSQQATVARPYAQAVLQLALRDQTLEHWSVMLSRMEDLVLLPQVRPLWRHPRVGASRLKDLLLELAGDDLDQRAANLLRLLVDAGRLDVMTELRRQYEALRDAQTGCGDAVVISNRPLDAARLAALSAALERRSGRRLRLDNRVDPALLGGAVIQMGDRVIDGSLDNRLRGLKRRLAGEQE
ncbi:MAG: F0F1 ATP synthase subunit delta [Magnetococcus sp. WYHC-3]